MEKFPFTSYDFWAYLASGFLVLGAADLAAGTQFVEQKDWTWAQTAIAVTAAYIVGQLVASMSSTLYERGLVGKVLGYPRHILFGDTKMAKPVRVLLAGYYTPLPDVTRQAAIEKGKVVGVHTPGEALFWPAFNVCKAQSSVMSRLENFLNQYGFARNISLVGLVDGAMLSWSYNFNGGPPLHGNLAWLALVASVGMTLRYLKFYRLYANEVFTTYAYAKETK